MTWAHDDMGFQLGDVREDGAIMTTSGWMDRGTIFVYRFQAKAAEAHGWVNLDPAEGHLRAVFGIDLVRVRRDAP